MARKSYFLSFLTMGPDRGALAGPMPDTIPPCRTAFRSNTRIVQHQIGTPSVISSEYCPPCLRNPVRHGPERAAVIDVHDTIETFRRGALDIDCTRMIVRQRKNGGPRFEGRGYLRQAEDGTLVFKLYVDKKESAEPSVILQMLTGGAAGSTFHDNELYELNATSVDGTNWTATRIAAPRPNWDMRDDTGVLAGKMHSIIADPVYPPRTCHLLRLHFFEEYEVPLHLWTLVTDRSPEYGVRDRAEFEACGAKFNVQKLTGSGDTVIEAKSETEFPLGFNLRIQEALQYITGKSAIWRARLEAKNGPFALELASPRPKAARTNFSPPISPASTEFHHHGWPLFARYLAYVVNKTPAANAEGLWNPVAYHLNNACESTSASVDAWAVGVSVAVEAVASLVELTGDQEKEAQWSGFCERVLTWLDGQPCLPESVKNRARGLIGGAGSKGVKQTLRELSERGYVDKENVDAWDKLRNRHVHPKLADLQIPGPTEYQELFTRLQRVGTLLHQLTFHLIEYEGPFTEYSQNGATRQYPLPRPENTADTGS